MKGLLIKEWFLIKKYCRAYLLITVVFLALSCVSDYNLFIVLYPCLLCVMIPITLQSYDERNGWTRYSGTLPYTKGQLVSCKYLTGLLTMLAILLATGIIQTVKMAAGGTFNSERLLVILFAMSILMFFSVSLCLPFIFKFGTEKGRIVYFVIVGLFCAGAVIVSNLFTENPIIKIDLNTLLLCLFLVGCGLYAMSWALSITFYKKREI